MKIFRKNKYSTYDNLRIMADPDLHKTMFSVIKNNCKKNDKILILASGTGAFDKRLINNAFQNITSVDISIDNYKNNKKTVKFLTVDLNKFNFYKKINDTYDVIIAMEIIEHIYSPNNFISNCKQMLNAKGKIFISTPNPHSFLSRIHNLLFGYPILFIAKPENLGHISPIFYNILEYLLKIHKMKIKQVVPVSHFFKNIFIYTNKTYLYYFSVLITSILLLPLYILISNKQKGLLSIYIIEHDNSNQTKCS